MQAPALGYLVSRYPAVSHTFILREVQHLRSLGHVIHTASINEPDRAVEAMDAVERAETAGTYFVKRHGAAGALAALAYWLVRSPAALLAMVMDACRLASGRRGIGYAAEAAMIARWMEAQGLQHLHVHFANSAATVALLVKRLTGAHLSCTVHGPDEFDDVPGQHLARKVSAFDRIVCISQFAKGQLMRIGRPEDWDRIEVCRLGVDPSVFKYAPRRRAAGAVQLLCVGRLTPAKGQVLLVQALAQVRERGLDATLTLVGQGPDEARIREAVTARGLEGAVRFTGALRPEEVRRALAGADIFVLPSLAEGIPVVLMEAMASGLPAISTPVNGIPELIAHGESGLLAAPGCVDSLVAQVEALGRDAALRARLAAAGRAKVVLHFNLPVNTARLGDIFATFGAPRAA